MRAVRLADGRAESPLETRGRLRIAGSGLAVAVEFDGRVKYTARWRDRSPAQLLGEEKRREDELRALDIGVVRMADADVGREWPRTEAALRRLLSRPGLVARRFTATPRARAVRRAG